MAVDGSGNVYVADTGNNAVKELLAVNGSIPASPTINALGGSSSFSGPSGVAVGGNGNVYVADTGHGTVDGLTPGCASSICVTTLGGSFSAPFGVAVDGSGNVYVGDSTSAKVVELELSAAPTLNFGTVKATTASSPQSVTVSNIGNTDMSLAAAFDATSLANGTFTLDGTSSCSPSAGSLTAGTDCTYAVDFSPISGTSYSGTLTLTDDDDNSPSPYATQTINLNGTGESIVFVTSSLASGTVGVALTPQTLQVSGGSGTYTFAATGLPAGLSLSSAGTLSGTPTAGGTFGSIQVTATDSSTGVNAVQTYSMTIASATITLATASLPNATYNSSYSHGLPAASGGTAPYSYNLFSGSLPPGLSVDSSTGVISGTPAQGGSYLNFVIQVTDSSTGTGPYSTTQTYSLTVDLANQATLTVTGVPVTAQAYGATFTVGSSGGSGTGAVTFAASGACSNTAGGTLITMISGTGTCSVSAAKAADSDYNSTISAPATVSATLANQATLTVTGVPGTAQAYGATFTVGSSGGSGTGAVTFAASGACSNTVGGALITMTSGTGTCSVSAAKAADSDYKSTISAAATVSATLANQAMLTVTGVPGTAQAYGATFTVGSSGGSGTGAVTFAASGACSNTAGGALITMSSGTGTCSVSAAKAADSDYNSTISAAATVSATLANQATLTVNVSTPAAYNTQQTLTTTGGSGSGTVTYSVGASTACSVTGATLSITSGSGSCSVTAIKAADSNYNSEASAAANVTVQPVLAIVNSLPIASAITYGQMLSVSTLTGGSATPSAGSFQWVTPSAVPLAGTQSESAIFVPTDTADYSSSAPVSVNVVVNPASFIVTVSSDDSGTASNCTPQSTPGHGTDASCSLRDALLEAAATKAGNITFDATAFGTAKTITLANGSLTLPLATAVAGTTTGSGASLANLVTIDGNGASAVFTIGSGVTGTSIANLVIRHGNHAGIQNAGALTLTGDSIVSNTATGSGGGINNSGALTLSSSTVSGNTAGGSGGGISNNGTLTLTDATIAGNNASTSGGGIYNTATLAVSDSTLSGNAAVTASGGGGIDNTGAGTTVLANDVVSGNTSNGVADDFDGVAYTDNGGNIVGVVNGATVNASAIELAPLGSYGGPTQTLIPLPGSAAFCAGLMAEIPSGLTTDQRGLPNTNASYPNYSTCVDAGAVQTNYALSFTTQPAGVSVATNFTTAVTLTESGSPFQPTVTIPLTLTGAGTLSGGSAATANGVASYTLEVNTAGSSDMLTANLVLNGAFAPAVAVSATSNTFAVGMTTTTITLGLSSASITYGTEETLMATLPSTATGTVTFYNNGSTILGTGTVVGGTASLSSSTLTAGSYLITAAYSGDSNYNPATTTAQSLTVKQATATITWSPAATIFYGTSLAGELNASAAYQNQNVTGTFSYTAQPAGGTAAAVTGATILPSGTYTLATSFTPSDLTDYNTVTDSVAITVSLGTLTAAANNATRVYGVANPGFTGSVTGAVNGDTFTESFSTTATIASNVGSYSIVPSAAGANIGDYSVAIQNGTLTISQAGTTTALGASNGSITPGQSVTLTAQVSSATSGTPTGSVNFYDGTTLLDTVTLSAGLASFTTSALSAGTTHQLTAEYSGDINFTSSSTSQFTPIVVAVLDFSLSSAVPTGQTVNSGSAATYQVVVAPLYGTYPGPVTFTTTGLPTGAVASFSPANIPANGGQQTVTVTIQTAVTSAGLQQAPISGRIRVPIALALLLLPLIGARRLRRQGKRFSRTLTAVLLLLGMTTLALSGCVSHTNFTPPSTYTVTITASSGNLQHATSVSLTVQ